MTTTTPPVTTITDDLLAELEQLAGKATPGPWVLEADDDSCMGAVYLVSEQRDYPQPIARLTGWHDQNYLAIANPATILALLKHVRELRADAERYHKLRTVTPYRFKKIQGTAITDGGDVFYFHSDKFDAALDASSDGLAREDKQ